ncbi:MAG: amidase [Gemmataceae bacterium]
MLTIHESAAAMRRGDLTPVDLLDQCLARIDAYEPGVRAWVVIDRDGAREQAERLTAELKRGEDRGPLHGIPIGVKDIIDVFDLPTGCGSKLWANSYARQDATCVKRLRQAGAVILGKTVTTAFAYLDPPVTRNPWNLDRTPGGSSSGSAAAVACGMCLAALGSQTVGSLTRPASYCGVCSFKPRKFYDGFEGVLPLAPTLDHIGVIARCIADLAIVGNALTADRFDYLPAHGDPQNVSARRPYPFFAPSVESLKRAEPEMAAAFARLTDPFREEDDCLEPSLPSALGEVPKHLRTILSVEAASFHGERLRRHPDDYPPKIRELVEEGLARSAVEYRQALDHCTATHREVAGYFLLAADLLMPAATGAAPDRSTTGDAWFNAPWSYSGTPTISLPVARTDDGMPLAVQCVGSASHEQLELFAAAAWLEREVGYDMKLPPVPK